MVLATINDAIVLNGVLVVRLNKARRNRLYKSYFNRMEYFYTMSHKLSRADTNHYYYFGGLDLVQGFEELTRGEFVDFIGENTVRKMEEFYNQHPGEIASTLIKFYYNTLNKRRIPFYNRLYYHFFVNMSKRFKDIIKINNSRVSVDIKRVPDKLPYNPQYLEFLFMTSKKFKPPERWKYKVIRRKNAVFRVYPNLGKTEGNFCIIDNSRTIDKIVERFGDWVKIVYYFLEANIITKSVKKVAPQVEQ